jgi:hypothetical protein
LVACWWYFQSAEGVLLVVCAVYGRLSEQKREASVPTEAVVSGHQETIRMDVHELVRRLNSHLGATLVAALAGVRDSKLPYRWAKPDGPTPNGEAEARLQMAHRVWLLLADAESDHVARSWFIGANPLLDEVPPYMALRAGEGHSVMRAAEAFIDGSWSA